VLAALVLLAVLFLVLSRLVRGKGYAVPAKLLKLGGALMLMGPVALFTVGMVMWSGAPLATAAWTAWAAQLAGFALAMTGLAAWALEAWRK